MRTGRTGRGALVSKVLALAAAVAAVVVPLLTSGVLTPNGHSGRNRSAAPHRERGAAFHHPGVLVSRAQLDFVRQKVRQGAQPWKDAYDEMRRSRYAARNYTPRPQNVVDCPPGNAPGHGCVEERQDAIAAYTDALMWYVTRDRAYADKAVEIMDDWSALLRTHTGGNTGLQAAWSGSTWARAAEIVRYSYPEWRPLQVQRFSHMLRGAYLPAVVGGSADYNGNWDLAMADATMSISVFLDDRADFDKAVASFRSRVPAYFYLRKDGPLPRPPRGSDVRTRQQLITYWFGQRRFVDGLAQETCRNLMHVGYSIAATAHMAETARLQGVDLYGEADQRLRRTMEFNAAYQLGKRPPAWLCKGRITRNMGPDLEVAYHQLHDRMHMSLPASRRLIQRDRPGGTDDLFVAWETLTHAENAH